MVSCFLGHTCHTQNLGRRRAAVCHPGDLKGLCSSRPHLRIAHRGETEPRLALKSLGVFTTEPSLFRHQRVRLTPSDTSCSKFNSTLTVTIGLGTVSFHIFSPRVTRGGHISSKGPMLLGSPAEEVPGASV